MCVDVIDVDAVEEPYEFEVFDVHKCFREFNDLCFDSTLEAVCVSWSKRLTLSAGKCQFKGQRYCEIRLSDPLLRYRTVKECKETLLHEMIHAHMFLTKQYRNCRAHGKEFIWHMNRVNEITGLNVTIYHNFHDELNYYRRHIWRCSVRFVCFDVNQPPGAMLPLGTSLRLYSKGTQHSSWPEGSVV
ncbi:SprT-like family domain-containing protein [Babesia divergens]|uniref:SprT-like family domain-containing protein n=1 Tax=Babesia divergens TaxID=32595 RepID=A0AAD9G8Y3_BABDI|nr:SprT-like family domain-containing protein [Babesia divergens]